MSLVCLFVQVPVARCEKHRGKCISSKGGGAATAVSPELECR